MSKTRRPRRGFAQTVFSLSDDVVLNQVTELVSLLLLVLGGVPALRRRRAYSRRPE